MKNKECLAIQSKTLHYKTTQYENTHYGAIHYGTTQYENFQYETTQYKNIQNKTFRYKKIQYDLKQNKNFKIKNTSSLNVFQMPNALLSSEAFGVTVVSASEHFENFKTKNSAVGVFSNSLIKNLKIKNKRCCNA